MAEPINLNKVRKDRARSQAAAEAAANRVKHGLTKGQKAAARSERIRGGRELDGHKREP